MYGFIDFRCGLLNVTKHFTHACLIEMYNYCLRKGHVSGAEPIFGFDGVTCPHREEEEEVEGLECLSRGMTYISSPCFGSEQCGKVKKLMKFVRVPVVMILPPPVWKLYPAAGLLWE